MYTPMSLDEGAPRHALAPLRGRHDTVVGEDPLDGVASEFMSEVLECAPQGRISPRRVLPSHAYNELTDVLRRGRSAWAPVLAAIVLDCDEVAVSTQKRSGCGNGGNLGQRLAAQGLGLDGEPTPIVVGEPETLAPKPSSEHTVLLSQVVNHILLLAVDPASQNEQ